MKKKIIQVLFVALGVLAFNLISCLPKSNQHSTLIPPHPVAQGVSAPFAGFIDQWMVVGGGCNFPNIPAADGGKKAYYSTFYACNTTADSLKWDLQTNFRLPIAYGASVETEKGLICIGGMNNQSSLSDVFRIEINHEKNGLNIHSLPSLPESIDNAAATYLDGKLYVTGGNQGNEGNSLYTLCLDTDTTWSKLADYPGAKRVQPVLLASDNKLFLMGGFQVDPITKKAIISADFITYNIQENSWSIPQPIPSMLNGEQRALVGCAGTRVGDQLFIAGGVNYRIFKDAVEGKAPKDYMKRPSEWYQFSKDLLIYDLKTGTWSVIPEVDGFNKAGGTLLHHNKSLFMVCGEIKPGIRTSEIVKKEISTLLPKSNIK